MSSPDSSFLTPRQRARELAFQFLFRYDQDSEVNLTATQLEEDFGKHAEHFKTREDSLEFALRLIQNTLKELKTVDAMIKKHAENWRLERLGTIEKSLLRIGTAELLYFKDVPASVTLNEIVELSKNFGEADTPSFINGILDPISREPQALAGKVPSDS